MLASAIGAAIAKRMSNPAGGRTVAIDHVALDDSIFAVAELRKFVANSPAYRDGSEQPRTKFSKRGITQQQLDADWSACRKENTVAMSFAEAYTETKRATSFAEEYLINGCMAARGYTVTW